MCGIRNHRLRPLTPVKPSPGDAMPRTTYVGRCVYHWPGDLQGCSPETGYLVPDIGDTVRVEYEGEETQQGEAGWLWGTRIGAGNPTRGWLPEWGWIPAWAVRRMRPRGPMKRRAWDGEMYTLSQWQDWYGDELGLLYWQQAPGY